MSQTPRLSSEFLASQHSVLLALGSQASVMQSGGRIDGIVDAGVATRSDESDQAVNAEILEIAVLEQARSGNVRQRVTDALTAIRLGAYGVCQQCKGPIAKTRLEAIPYAENCIGCQKVSEAK